MTGEQRRLRLILCWHMHQPDYRDYASGESTLPWTYLHALKDYTDMVRHLERHPQARAVFNFVPVLLDQLEAYVQAFREGAVRDPLLRLLAVEDLDRITDGERQIVLNDCFRANHTTMVEPFPAFKRLVAIYRVLEESGGSAAHYVSGQYMADLLVWYHLAWTGETVRREHEFLIGLMTKGERFTHADRLALYRLIGEILSGLLARYKALADAGRIELSSTPHYHPLAPLLLDFRVARESVPDVQLPDSPCYPNGPVRVAFHVESALSSHEHRFGARPQGVWPAEGGVSDAFLRMLGQRGCRWTASGEGVLANSLRHYSPADPGERRDYLYRPYHIQAAGTSPACFFRDDRLSDLIGFEYGKWNGEDAVKNFVHELEAILANFPTDAYDPVVSIILDGENAWEYYPYNGYYFLDGLYEALARHPAIEMTTFSAYLDGCAAAGDERASPSSRCATFGVLPSLVAGSWVYGTFSTWIGSPDKNRAWDLLCKAKQSFDLMMASDKLTEEEKHIAHEQLADFESSDWFWWFGDDNPRHSVESFDTLFRANLRHLYALLKLPAPEWLDRPVSRGGAEAAERGGTMRRAS